MLVNRKIFLISAILLLSSNYAVGAYAQLENTQNQSASAGSAVSVASNPEITTNVSKVQSISADVSKNISSTVDTKLKDTVTAIGANQDVNKQSTDVSNVQSKQELKAVSLNAKDTASSVSVAAPKDKSTQVELELNRKVPYKIFYLSKPSRLVIDIKDGSFSADFDKTAFANSPIKNIRTSHRSEGVFRIVFDLKDVVNFQHSEQIGSGNNPQSMKLIITILPKEEKSKSSK